MSVLRLWTLKAFALLALYLASPNTVVAQTFLKTPVTEETYASVLKNYYRAPQPDIATIISFAVTQGLTEARPKRLQLIAFMAGLISDDEQIIDKLAPVFAKFQGDQPQRLVRAILYSGRSDWKEQIERLKKMWPTRADEIDRIAANGARAVSQLKRDGQPEVLDMNWAYFGATGRHEPVMAIVEGLGDLRSSDIEKVKAAHAARLSLAKHAIDHERVFDICLRSQWSSFGDQLRLIVAAASTHDLERFRMEAEAAERGTPVSPDAQVLTARSRKP